MCLAAQQQHRVSNTRPCGDAAVAVMLVTPPRCESHDTCSALIDGNDRADLYGLPAKPSGVACATPYGQGDAQLASQDDECGASWRTLKMCPGDLLRPEAYR